MISVLVTRTQEKEGMWLWYSELQKRGFRRLSERYWQCERGYGLPVGAYLSLFPDACERMVFAGGCERFEVCAFHVTFCLGVDRVHFYYHEYDNGIWEPGGHTSRGEILRYNVGPDGLRNVADQIATELIEAFGMSLLERDG